jgi:hypothetical protein
MRLQDKTSRLILIDISHIQLLVGSTTLFFNLPFTYAPLAEGGWLVSIWEFLSSIKLRLYLKDTTLPAPACQHDLAIMDYFHTLSLCPLQLHTLN